MTGRALEPLLATAVVAAVVLPPERLASFPVLCPIRRATGRPCPGCGMTRSWTLAMHGRVLAAFRAHALGPLALAFALALLAGPRAAGVKMERETGVEPATFSLEG